MIVVGEVKAIEPSRYGHKIVLKHLADMPFMVNDDLHKRMAKRFADELELWNSIESAHLVMIGTFGLGPTGVASLEELALMVVTQEWLPIESVFELDLLAALVEQKRHFTKDALQPGQQPTTGHGRPAGHQTGIGRTVCHPTHGRGGLRGGAARLG